MQDSKKVTWEELERVKRTYPKRPADFEKLPIPAIIVHGIIYKITPFYYYFSGGEGLFRMRKSHAQRKHELGDEIWAIFKPQFFPNTWNAIMVEIDPIRYREAIEYYVDTMKKPSSMLNTLAFRIQQWMTKRNYINHFKGVDNERVRKTPEDYEKLADQAADQEDTRGDGQVVELPNIARPKGQQKNLPVVRQTTGTARPPHNKQTL